AVRNFYERVNLELEGQLVACRLLAHKIQSPHEKEALNALQVLDACVRNCGQRFHNEMAKFKFLNEIIKILSPKYLGNQTSENVKKKAIESLYSWKMTLKHLPKIKQAYDMLKEQGIVLQDPTYVDEIFEPLPAPPAKPKLATFEDDEKARLLSQLLKSKNPDDIQAANRLIKNMVKAEDQKMEKMSKRCSDLTTAANNARLLQEMLHEFNKSTTMQQEIEIMKELADSLVKLRPALFRYAGESSENDEESDNRRSRTIGNSRRNEKVEKNYKTTILFLAFHIMSNNRNSRRTENRCRIMKLYFFTVGLLAFFITIFDDAAGGCCCYGPQRLEFREGCGKCDLYGKPDTFVKCVGGQFVELKCLKRTLPHRLVDVLR
uniref:VHS domain-containing protein n=1 Tax=Romanomermis culicivorax TaxID=13658 RepID=A0A915HUG3_ROMCU